jgi:hypothetical protein
MQQVAELSVPDGLSCTLALLVTVRLDSGLRRTWSRCSPPGGIPVPEVPRGRPTLSRLPVSILLSAVGGEAPRRLGATMSLPA